MSQSNASTRSTNSSTKQQVSISAQERWAGIVSDYILRRRKQTHDAYLSEISTDTNTLSDGLFKALFTALTSQLEEGHTVLTLKTRLGELPQLGVITNALNSSSDDQPAILFNWQQILIEVLASPLFDLITINGNSDITQFDYLNILFEQNIKLWEQVSQSRHNRVLLQQRLALVKQIYKIFVDGNKVVNAQVSSQKQANASLTMFIEEITRHSLFSAADYRSNSINGNSLSKINTEQNDHFNTPIKFQLMTEELEAEVSTISFTLWIHRTWQAEFNLASNIANLMQQSIEKLPIQYAETLNAQQISAIEVANNNSLSIITGGPGTGKTYTVAQLVMALEQAQNTTTTIESKNGGEEHIAFSTDSANLALAAPTGKAAQRMQESLQAALNSAQIDTQLSEAKTIHRLLGIGRNGRPRYNRDNPLGEEVIIVDEASMLGVELANYLVNAIKPGARLILLGDANQLAAVDAGSVLADLCRIEALRGINVELTESRRFSNDSGIGKLASLINQESLDKNVLWSLFSNDKALNFTSIVGDNDADGSNNQSKSIINSLSKEKILFKITQNYRTYINKTKIILQNPTAKSRPESKNISMDINELMKVFNTFRVLTAGHHGTWGDDAINTYLSNWHRNELQLPLGKSPWYHGRPVMVLQNNYELGLYNGDIGICLQTSSNSRDLNVYFENKPQGIAIDLLNDELISAAYAMTIHKSQGSEFEHVAITFDSSHTRLLSKELIYTAVTRAKEKVTIFSTPKALIHAIQTPTQRQTGLSLQFTRLIEESKKG